MTFLGFVLAVVIIGVIFYAWYAYVHRNGTYNAAEGARANRVQRTRTATNMETGTIGEREREADDTPVARDRALVPYRQVNAGRYMEETGLIGDLPSRADIDAANAVGGMDVQDDLSDAIHQAFHEEIGEIGEFGTAKQNLQASTQTNLTSAIHEAFQEEIGEIGTAKQNLQQSAQTNVTSAIHNAFQEEIGEIGTAKQNLQQSAQTNLTSAIHEAFQEEIGEIGSPAKQQGGEGGDNLTDAIHQAFRNEFYSMNKGTANNKKQR